MTDKKENSREVFARTYFSAANSDCNMHRITDILEEIKTMFLKESDYKKVDDRINLHLGEILDNDLEFIVIQEFRNELRKLEREKTAQEINETYKAGEKKGWNHWLETFGRELSRLNLDTCSFLLNLKVKVPETNKTEYDFIKKHFSYIKDERWVEGNSLFEFLIQKKLKSSDTVADLNVLAGEVRLYHLMDYEQAYRHFKTVAGLIPGTAKAERVLGIYFIQKNDFKTAKQHLQKAMELDKKDSENHLVLGDLYKAENRHDTAAGWYNEGLRENPGKADLFNRLLLLNEQPAYFEKNHHKTDDLLKKIKKLSPDIYYTAVNNAAFVYQKNGNFEKAEEYYRKAAELNPERIQAWCNMGYSFLEKNDLNESEKSFKKVIQLDKKAFEGYWGLVAVYRKMENWNEVISCLKQCEKYRKEWLPYIYNDFGSAYEKSGDSESGQKYYLLALKHDPEKNLGLNALYDLAESHPEVEKGISLLEKVKKIKGPSYESNFFHEAGVVYYKKQLYQEAIQHFQKSVELTPGDPIRLEYLGLAFEKYGDFGKAVEYYQKAIENATYDKSKYYNRLAFLQIDLQHYTEAVNLLQQAIELDPQPLYFENMGFAMEKSGNFKEAENYYLQALKLGEHEKDIYENRLGVFYYNQKDYKKAVKHYNKAINHFPKSIYFENLGLVYENTNQLKEAEENYRNALNISLQRKEADIPRYYNRLAFFLSNIERHEEAIDLLRIAVQIKPSPIYYENMGYAFEKLGKSDEAEENYRKALQLEQYDKDIYLNRLGVFYYNQNKTETAIEYYLQSIDKNPKAVYFENLGNAYHVLRKKEEFEKAFLEAVKLEPEEGKYYFQLGWNILDAYGDTETAKKYLYKAIELYKKTPEIEPEELMSIQFLGAAYEKEGNWDKAGEIFLEAYKIDPENDLICSFLGKVCFNKNNYQKALEYYEKAYQLNPDRATNYINYGDVLKKTGDKEKALAVYSEGATIDPGLFEKVASIYFDAGDYTNAEKFIRLAIKAFPKYNIYHENLGVTLQKLMRFEEARDAFVNALKNTPYSESHVYLNLIGNTWYAQNEYKTAAGYYEEALKISPDNSIYFENLISSLNYSYQRDKALELLNKKTEKDPGHIYSINQLGVIFFQSGDCQKALEYFKKHLELEPSNAIAYDNLGFALEKLNEPREAAKTYLNGVSCDVSFYEKAIKIYIGLEDYETAQKILEEAKEANNGKEFFNVDLTNFLKDQG
jgi:tetratricopeptide (TPR) repeat protein